MARKNGGTFAGRLFCRYIGHDFVVRVPYKPLEGHLEVSLPLIGHRNCRWCGLTTRYAFGADGVLRLDVLQPSSARPSVESMPDARKLWRRNYMRDYMRKRRGNAKLES